MERVQNTSYFHANGSCYLCGQPNDCVDTSVQITGEGVLAICHGCIHDLAMTAGYVLSDNKAQVEQLVADLDDQTKRADAAEEMLRKLRIYEARVENLAQGREKRAAVSA